MNAPSRDEFSVWLADPVTVFVLAGLRVLAVKQEEAFTQQIWAATVDKGEWAELHIAQARCRVRAESYSDLAAITIEDAYGANGLEAPPKEPA